MRVTYKQIKVSHPHCGDCGEYLYGDNSIVSPYRCPCGEWEVNWLEGGRTWEFILKKLV